MPPRTQTLSLSFHSDSVTAASMLDDISAAGLTLLAFLRRLIAWSFVCRGTHAHWQ